MAFVISNPTPFVKNHRGIVPPMVYKPGTAARRMRRLLEELVQEEVQKAGEWGAKQRVADALELEQATFSKMLNEQRNAGVRSIETVMAKLKIRWEYFFGEAEPDSYKEFVGPKWAAYRDFLRTDEGKDTTEGERDFLESVPFMAGPPTVATYQALLYAYRGAYARKRERMPKEIDQILDASMDAEQNGSARDPTKG